VKPSLLALLACAFTLVASRGDTQQDQFARAVGELVQRTTDQQPTPLGPVIDRMAAALADWDRNITTLESRTAAELPQASGQRAFQLHVELGVTYRQRGRLVEALREFAAAAALQSSASDVHVLRALTLEAARRPEEASAAFHQAWTLDRQNPFKAYYVLQRMTGADAERARQVVKAAYQRSLAATSARKSQPFLTVDVIPDNWPGAPIVGDVTTADAFALLAAGKYSEAVTALNEAEARAVPQPAQSPLTHFARARRSETEGQLPEARREYEAAIAGALAGRSLIYIAIGRLAQVEGDLAGAIDAFGRAVRLNPNHPGLHRELAGALAAGDRIDDALVELMIAVLIDPSDASVLAAIGQQYIDSGRYADAVPALTRALEIAPSRFETHYALATALTHLGKSVEAARELERFERARQQMIDKRRRDIDSVPPGGER
jgi:tetratricopeptide (TPR) repeat protein